MTWTTYYYTFQQVTESCMTFLGKSVIQTLKIRMTKNGVDSYLHHFRQVLP